MRPISKTTLELGDRVTFTTQHRSGPAKVYVGTIVMFSAYKTVAQVRDDDPKHERFSTVAVTRLSKVDQ